MPRPRKGPHTYRRPGRPGLWGYIDRNNRHIPLDTDDPREAAQKLAALLDDRGLRPAAEGRKSLVTLADEHRIRSETNHAKNTTIKEGGNAKRLLVWLDSIKVHGAHHVTREVIERFKASRRLNEVSAYRINSELQTWKAIMRLAVEQGEASKSILDAFVKLREPRPQPNQVGLTAPEIKRFLAAEKHAGYRAMFRLAVGAGLRDDELSHLDAANIQPPHIVVTPKPPGACACCPKGWHSKGYRYRHIPVTAETIKAARAFVKAKPGLNLTDKKMVWRRVQAAGRAAKIKQAFSLHELRRAYASHALMAGYRLEQISQWLGHADLKTTQRYLRVVDGGVVDTSRLVF